MSFAQLRKQRGDFASLSKKLGEEKGGGYGKDERYWDLKTDEAGNGYAVIRFLPAPAGEDYPFAKLFEYGFKNEANNRWYIEKSRDTLNEPDPVSEKWAELWNSGDKVGARKYSRSTRYISNILVISDPKNPENEGKVFLYKYGPRIFQKIEGALQPEFQDEVAINPFDLWEGANFKLKARKLDGQRSYDKSEFEKPEALFAGDDAALEKLYNTLYSLKAEIAPDKFKSYDELKKRFLNVLGVQAPVASSQQRQEADFDQVRAGAEEAPWKQPEASPSKSGDDDSSAELSRYASLLNDD